MAGSGDVNGEDFSFAGRDGEEEREKEGPNGLNKLGSSSTAELHPKAAGGPESGVGKQMPPASVMTRLILIMVWRKLIRNPNTYSSLIGLVWSLIAFRSAHYLILRFKHYSTNPTFFFKFQLGIFICNELTGLGGL